MILCSSVIKDTGGGLRVKNEVGLFLKISFEYKRMQKTASKNIIPSGSYEFLKSGSIQLGTIPTLANFKSRYLKTTLRTFFEKTMHGRGPKLGNSVPLISFNNLISGIFEKIFLSIFMGKNVPNMDKISIACVHFCP